MLKLNHLKFENKKRKLKLSISLLFLILLFSQIIFSSESINSYDYLKVKINSEINFQIEKENKYNVNFFEINSFSIPITINNSQYLNDFTTSNSNYKINKEDSENNYLTFNYDKNTLKEKNKINIDLILQSTTIKPRIENIVKYPILKIKDKDKKYLEFSGLIDTNFKIKNKARELTEGKDDLFIISTEIAKWIQNDIKYDLSSILSKPNQKSSDVFNSKVGVCKEITNLYVSMLRSVGIPARVVTGYAYTNSEKLINYLNSNWGGHAWAEVLIDNKWVPFDLTYNQYGYVDATHLIFERSKDSKESNIKLNASGYGFTLVKNSLKTENKFTILEKNDIYSDKLNFDIKISGPNEIGFDSYGYLEINIQNQENIYQVLFLNIVKTQEVESTDLKQRMLVFKPNEKKTIYYKYKIPNLDKGYSYTFPFSLQNEHINIEYLVKSKEDFKRYKLDDLPKEEEKEEVFSKNKIDLGCNFSIKKIDNLITCDFKNKNNYQIKNIKFCIDNNCSIFSLNLNEEKKISYETADFNKNLSLSYNYKCNLINCSEDKKISLEIPKPYLEIEKKKVIKNEFFLTYLIRNNNKNFKTNIYLNNNLIKRNSNERNSQDFILDKLNNSIFIELKQGEKILDFKKINILISNQTLNQNKIILEKRNKTKDSILRNFIQNMIDFFEMIF